MFVIVEHDPQRTIGMRTSGRYPWWVDPDLRIAFFRPLASLPTSSTTVCGQRSCTHARAQPRLTRGHVRDGLGRGAAAGLESGVAGLAALIFTLSFTHVVSWRAIAVRFRFRAALDHESFVWTTWKADEFVVTDPMEFCRQSSD